MPELTPNLGLKKPTYNENADIGVINENMDLIDEKVSQLEQEVGSINYPVKSVNSKTGNVVLSATDVGAAPTKHASQHGSGGSDPITPAMIGAETPAGAQAKANTAESNAKSFADSKFVSMQLSDTQDWDYITNPGVNLLVAGSAPNGPAPGSINVYFHPLIIKYYLSNLTQIAIPYGSGANITRNMYIRGLYSGVWSPWKRFVYDGDTAYDSARLGGVLAAQYALKADVSKVVSGTYRGDGYAGLRTIDLGFTPKFVMVISQLTQFFFDPTTKKYRGGFATTGAGTEAVSIVTGGFRVKNDGEDGYSWELNQNFENYIYFALA